MDALLLSHCACGVVGLRKCVVACKNACVVVCMCACVSCVLRARGVLRMCALRAHQCRCCALACELHMP
eukprot:2742695-Alexandrium_andersonii.AAC.1